MYGYGWSGGRGDRYGGLGVHYGDDNGESSDDERFQLRGNGDGNETVNYNYEVPDELMINQDTLIDFYYLAEVKQLKFAT